MIPGLKVIKLEYSLTLKIKRIDWLYVHVATEIVDCCCICRAIIQLMANRSQNESAHTHSLARAFAARYTQGWHMLEKYLNWESFLEKSLKIKSALKSTGKYSKALKSPWILLFSVGLSTVDRDLNQCKKVVPLLAHLSRRLRGELLVYQWLRRPSSVRPSSVRRPSVNIFKHLLLWNHWANWTQISYGDSLGWGNESLFKCSWSHDQDGHHAHIW